MNASKRGDVPPEFSHLIKRESIPWKDLIKDAKERMKEDAKYFKAFTDAAIDLATKESMKENPDPALIILGMEACIGRGRFAECLFISTGSEKIDVLSLRAIALFTLSDAKSLREVLHKLESVIDEQSSPSDQVRLSSVKVLLGAVERDTSVIMCVMELDNLLEAYPEQIEEPLSETIFTLYVVGVLLTEVGQGQRALRIAEVIAEMAHSLERRTALVLSENLRGRISGTQGNFVQSEVHFKRVLEISDDLSSNVGLGMAANNLSQLMLYNLRLEEAYEYLQSAYELLEMGAHRIVILSNLGEISTLLGRYDEGEKHLQQALKLDAKIGVGYIEPYTWMVILLSRTGRLREAKKILGQARKLVESTEKPKERAAFFHAKGVLEACEGKIAESYSSMTEALKVAKENDLIEWLVRSVLDIVRTYLNAFSDSGDSKYLSNAAYHLDDLIQIAEEQGLKALYAETLLLRSDIRSHGGRLLEAKGDLERVVGIATFLENSRLEREAKAKLLALTADVPEIPGLNEAGRTMDRVAGFRPTGPLKDVPRPILHSLLALNRASGLPEFVHAFDARLEMDSSLLSAFISAITAFSGDMMGDSGLIRSINHEGFTLMMEHTHSRIVTLIANQETFDIRYRLHEFALRFEKIFPESVDSVATADYVGAEDLLESIFRE